MALSDVFRLHQFSKAIGIVKVADPVVTLAAEIPQGAGIDHPRQTAQQEENQDLDIKLFMYETELIHRSPPFP